MFETIFKEYVDTAYKYVWETPEVFPWIVALLLATGVYITFRMGWINVRKFKHAIDVVRGRYDNPEDEGDINHFQALTTALSATVGIGNIAGVATAIHYGGPGTIFWLWVSGIFGMTLKFAECTLSMLYRTFDKEGHVSGGPMYYIERGLGKNWKWMAILFAALAVVGSFGSGNMNQSNTVAVSAAADFNAPDWLVGIILATAVGLVILGGIKRIGAVSARVMPTMAVIYILGALYILINHAPQLPGLFAQIFTEAWKPKAAFGGTAAGVWHFTLLWGIKRALFSNEAGQGSAPIAHAAAKTKEPIREGVVAMVGPFIDTLVICTLTGLVICVTGVWNQKKFDMWALETNKIDIYMDPGYQVEDGILHLEDGPGVEKFQGSTQVNNGKAKHVLFSVNDSFIENAVLLQNGEPYTGTFKLEDKDLTDDRGENLKLDVEGKSLLNSSALTAWAFQIGFKGLGKFGNYIVTICVFLFAFSTIVSWSYYGDRCVEYLFGIKYVMIYRVVYIGFTYMGAVLALETVWTYGDVALGSMMVPNLIAVLLLSPKLVPLTKEYFSRKHKRYK
ncbi:sodium:alanine symporter family protein [bacterium I07]|nr:sodium:alanine symporter family protein [bacterium I07]